ncbi:MAG: ribonuclease H-like domain-containing protein [Desulfobacterales bacterium]|nr:ribonuclease H-like domain-containing protein [Desulfobacterales bacterium]
MLTNTFIHIPGIGIKSEKNIWQAGVMEWQDFKPLLSSGISRGKALTADQCLQESISQLENDNPSYFSKKLPANQQWRFFPDFRKTAAYIDIETTGLDTYNKITTIALYDGNDIHWYVHGKNLDDFAKDIFKYKMVITYNGKSFDVPFIENYFGIKMNHAHIDLRYVLSSLGYKGGLKKCEKAFGIDRGELDGVDGFFAVILWNEYIKNNNRKALETLLAYNIEDVINLEYLMVAAYNLKLKSTPFYESKQIDIPETPEVSFKADLKTVKRLKPLTTHNYYY